MGGSIIFIDVAYWKLIKKVYDFKFTTEPLHLYASDLEKGVGLSYAKAFERAGWKVNHIYINDLPKQYLWLNARSEYKNLKTLMEKLLLNNRHNKYVKYLWLWFGLKIARLQIAELKPEFLWNFDPVNFPIFSVVKNIDKINTIAQVGSPIKFDILLNNYSSIVTSHPEYFQKYSQKFKNCSLIKAAFDLDNYIKSNWNERTIESSFVGSLTKNHKKRLNFLDMLSKNIDLKTFGFGFDNLSPISKLRLNWGGEVWGDDYYKLLSKTKISINYHADFVSSNSTNLRIFESTGMGSILLTNFTNDLNSLFDIDREVLSYNNIFEAVEKINYILNNPLIAESIAVAGMKKTHNSHNYDERISEILKKVSGFN